MKSVIIIQNFKKKLTALFLLGAFILAITPKKTLHSLLANHTDSTYKVKEGKNQQLSKAGFNCNTDDLVAESNFVCGAGFTITVPVSFLSVFLSFYSSYISSPHFFLDLRGPPLKF